MMGAKKQLNYIKNWLKKQRSHYEKKEYKDTEYSKGLKEGILLMLDKFETVLDSGYEDDHLINRKEET